MFKKQYLISAFKLCEQYGGDQRPLRRFPGGLRGLLRSDGEPDLKTGRAVK